jgi:hypothetical protein
MKGDIIKCLNCGKTFKDTTQKTDKLTKAGNEYQWKGQDSRKGNFKNMCLFCYSTHTKNTHKEAKRKQKFIYFSDTKVERSHPTSKKKVIKKPNINDFFITKKVLGYRQNCNVKNNGIEIEHIFSSLEDFVLRTKGTFEAATVKPFTPIELMEHKLKAQYKELLSPPDNREKYKRWRYDKRLKK